MCVTRKVTLFLNVLGVSCVQQIRIEDSSVELITQIGSGSRRKGALLNAFNQVGVLRQGGFRPQTFNPLGSRLCCVEFAPFDYCLNR